MNLIFYLINPKKYLMTLFFASFTCLYAQEVRNLNFIVAVNNTLILDGKIAFITEEAANDTLYAEYYLGSVKLCNSDFVKLESTKKCDIIFDLFYTDVHGWGKSKRYLIRNVCDIADMRVLVLAFYENNKKREMRNYESGYIGNTYSSHNFNIQGPKQYKNVKMFNKLLQDFMRNTPF